jgi:hypothetical protein
VTGHKRCENSGCQRLVITIDIPDEPGNEKLAIDALTTLIRHFEYDAVYPIFMRLELGPVRSPQ